MILKIKTGNILKNNEKRIAFAINTEGANDIGFSGIISDKFWPELAFIREQKLGTVLAKKVNDIYFFALCCYSLKNEWMDQDIIIRDCFNAIPGDQPIASASIGTGIIGADFSLIHAGMEASCKKIILY